MSVSLPVPLGRLLLLAGLAPTLLPAQPAPAELAPYAVTATRTPAALATLGSAVETIEAAELARQQVTALCGALAGVPGAPTGATGASGGAVSLFLRGANSNQTLFLVDGLRFNDANTDYGVALGGAGVGAFDRLEVTRGPQSTLYGGDAVGGVVALQARRGQGAPSAALALEAGSFGTVRGTGRAQAGDAQRAYSLSLSGGRTANVRPNNSLTTASHVLRLDRRVNDAVAVGATWRGFTASYGDPGDRFTNDPDNRLRENNQLATVFADLRPGPGLDSRVTLGGQDRRFVAENPGPGGREITVVKNRRAVLDGQGTWTGATGHRLTGGATAELSHTVNTGFGAVNRHQRLLAVFVQDEWTARPDVFLTAGLRRDGSDTFGPATTGRVTAAWLPAGGRLKLRASYGTGFRAPGFLDLYGRSAFYADNPHLRPERAGGGDAGADWYFANGRGAAGATLFRTGLRDLITYDFSAFPGTMANVERARTQGVELTLHHTVAGRWGVRTAYTYLEAVNHTGGTRLLRRPRHAGAADLWRNLGGGWSAGVGARFVADRRDVDAQTYGPRALPGYTVVRVYAEWRATPRLTLRARVENLLDASYEEVHGYPQPGRGLTGGVEWRF